jgi:inosose dehydratase
MAQLDKPFDATNVWIGITPTSWWNDDFLDIDAGIPFEQCVSEMALAGFAGCSVGHKYPTDIPTLKKELGRRNLRISEPWTSLFFTANQMRQSTVDNFKEELHFIKEMGGTDVVVAELGRSVHQRPLSIEPNRPHFTEEQWKELLSGLKEIGEYAAKQGMNLCYHPHIGTGVEKLPEIDRLMENTDPNYVHLLYDTGHLYFAGVDPLNVANKYAKRIKHVHLKNVRQAVLEKVQKQGLSFHDAIIDGIFTVPGDPAGCIDFVPIFNSLAVSGFTGWLIVEAEQDPRVDAKSVTPLDYAKMAREYIRQVTGL